MTGQPVKYDVAERLGRAMCDAWGLDPNYVTRIVVVWEPHDLPHAQVDMLMSESAIRELLTLSVVEREVSDTDGSAGAFPVNRQN